MDENEMYEMSDSEDDFIVQDKILFNQQKSNRKNIVQDDDEDAVFNFSSDDSDNKDESDDGKSDIDMGSDLEDVPDNMPNERAWGTKRKNFYHTDYVDQDYAGILKEKEIETAELEEEEARNIQKRLVAELNDADFSLCDLVTESNTPAVESESISTDISQLTKRQKLDLLRKESPEFSVLVDDFLVKITELKDRINPAIQIIEEQKLATTPAVDYLKLKRRIIANYGTNIIVYLMLKAKREPMKEHPVLKALFRYRQLLNQLITTDNDIINGQLDALLEKSDSVSLKSQENPKSLKRLSIIKKIDKIKKSVIKPAKKDSESEDDNSFSNSDNESNDAVEPDVKNNGKRAITYEMAKNKGLTPKRSKEQRNPRVKHRNKYRKAMIRRRGQVRTTKSEIPVYGGEPTGIKIGLTRGRKLK